MMFYRTQNQNVDNDLVSIRKYDIFVLDLIVVFICSICLLQ